MVICLFHLKQTELEKNEDNFGILSLKLHNHCCKVTISTHDNVAALKNETWNP